MRSFNEIPFYDFENTRNEQIVKEIQSKGKEYILGVDEDEYINYLYEKYLLEPLFVDKSTEFVGKPRVSKEMKSSIYYGGEQYEVNVYTFTVKYNYTGTGELFRVQSNPWTMTSCDIDVNDNQKTVSFSFKVYNQDPEEFKREKEKHYRSAFANLINLNNNIKSIINSLKNSITHAFQQEKEKYRKENDFFTAINIKVNPETSSVFSVPTVKKKAIPQPMVSNSSQFTSEPMMTMEMYKDILKVVYDSGKNMEKKPALYQGKDEEGLRDQFLFVLETRYEGTTASGETFNRSGKTDILLKYASDGSNVFVAECKFWHGSSEFLAAVSQLFERYLTWRDSKVALILFVKNKDFTSVLNSIRANVKQHGCYVSHKGDRGESSFSYLFCLPQDRAKTVYFEVMAFHYDK